MSGNGTSSTTTIKLSTLRPYEQNPRRISAESLNRLCQSIERDPEFMELRPIIVDDDGVIVGGNQRYRALLKLGRTEVPEAWVRRGRFTAEQRRRFILVDNGPEGMTGEWDFDVMAQLDFQIPDLVDLGFDERELRKEWPLETEPKDAEPRIGDRELLNKEWQVRPGDLWQIGPHRLLCGDCTRREDVERLVGDRRASMTWTDPPWNVAIGQDSNPRHRQRAGLINDNLSAKDFAAFLAAFAELVPVAAGGDLYCVLGASEWPTLDLALRGAGFHWSATVIWVKDMFVLGRSKYHRRYEPLWYGWHRNETSSFGGARDLDDVWEIERPRRSEEHPTMKPVALVARAISNSSEQGQRVYDPFMGSGTTLIAAHDLNRHCIGLELSPEYCAVILQRAKDALGLTGQRLD